MHLVFEHRSNIDSSSITVFNEREFNDRGEDTQCRTGFKHPPKSIHNTNNLISSELNIASIDFHRDLRYG